MSNNDFIKQMREKIPTELEMNKFKYSIEDTLRIIENQKQELSEITDVVINQGESKFASKHGTDREILKSKREEIVTLLDNKRKELEMLRKQENEYNKAISSVIDHRNKTEEDVKSREEYNKEYQRKLKELHAQKRELENRTPANNTDRIFLDNARNDIETQIKALENNIDGNNLVIKELKEELESLNNFIIEKNIQDENTPVKNNEEKDKNNDSNFIKQMREKIPTELEMNKFKYSIEDTQRIIENQKQAIREISDVIINQGESEFASKHGTDREILKLKREEMVTLLDSKRKELEMLKEQENEYNKAISSVIDHRNKIEEEVKSREEHNKEYQRKLKELHAQKRELENRTPANNTDRNFLNNTRNDIETQIKALENSIDGNNLAIKELKEELQSLNNFIIEKNMQDDKTSVKDNDEDDKKDKDEDDKKDKDEDDKKDKEDDINDSVGDYDEYALALQIYKDDMEKLYELQGEYEKGNINYSEYQTYSMYMVGREKFMMEWYERLVKESSTKKDLEEENPYKDLTDEELEKELAELNAEYNEEYQFRAQEQNGMEETDGTMDKLLEQIKAIGNEMKARQENPLKKFTKEELEKKLAELNAEYNEEYQFRAQEQNGMEENENDDTWNKLNEEIKTIEEELENRAKNNNGKPIEKPDNCMFVEEKGREDDDKDKDQRTMIKSGLQIFREQFNQMPDIKNRHTLSERLGILQPIGVAAGIILFGTNPIIGGAVAVTSLISKGLSKRLTGQRKLEKQIYEQFMEMDEAEFNRMVDYLTEEQIQDLKPNAVILNALHKALQTKTQNQSKGLKDEKQKLIEQRDQLLEKVTSTTTLSKNEILVANSELEKVNEAISNIEKKAPIVERRLKDIRRGKDRVSARYKGNLATRFNIFAHRNSTTKQYKAPINELADAEYERDSASFNGNHIKSAAYQKEMENIMSKHTYTGFLGIQKSVFNARKAPVRIMDDREDRTTKTVATVALIGFGLYMSKQRAAEIEKIIAEKDKTIQGLNKGIEMQNKQIDAQNIELNNLADQQVAIKESNKAITDLQNGGDTLLTEEQAQKIADGQVTDYIARGEHTSLNINSNTSSGGYIKLDEQSVLEAEKFMSGSKVSGDSPSEFIDKLVSQSEKALPNAEAYAKSVTDGVTGNVKIVGASSGGYADHSKLFNNVQDAPEQIEAETAFLKGVKRLLNGIKGLNPIVPETNIPNVSPISKISPTPIDTTNLKHYYEQILAMIASTAIMGKKVDTKEPGDKYRD